MFYHDHRCSPQSARFCNNYYHPICDITATLQEYKPVARARPPSHTPLPVKNQTRGAPTLDAISLPLQVFTGRLWKLTIAQILFSHGRTNERMDSIGRDACSLSLSLDTIQGAAGRVDSGDTGKNRAPGALAITRLKSRNRGLETCVKRTKSMVLQSLFALSAMMVIIIVVVVSKSRACK